MAYRLNRLGKSFASGQRILHVLKDLSVEFPEGASVAIQGASGCGKTTLLNLMGGLDRPTEGEVFWKDTNITALGRADAAAWRNRQIGFVFQRYHLMPQLTALENVQMPAWLGRRENKERAIDLLEKVGLADRLQHLPKELSGGEQQRVAIARALINDPQIILADEPTGNLDNQTGKSVLNLLLDLTAQTQKALILVTHDNEVAKQLSRCYSLRDGYLESNV